MRPLSFALAAALAAGLSASAARADDLRDFCPQRPGLNTPPCIIDKGHADVETELFSWSLDRQDGSRTDTFSVADTLVRYGLTDSLEVQVDWLPYARVRERSGNEVHHSGGSGDLTIGLKQSLINPDGSGLSIAVLPFATLPIGGHAAGAGDWGAGLLVPISKDLGGDFQLAFTPSVEASVDEDRSGRHLAYGLVGGLGIPLGQDLNAAAELSAQHDEDPVGASTSIQAGLSLAWKAADDLQLDAGSNIGLDKDAPDVELYFGISRRF